LTYRPHLRLACGCADSVCLCGRRYLHHALTRPHTRAPTHTTPMHATKLQSHLPPDHTPAPHSNLYFGYKQNMGLSNRRQEQSDPPHPLNPYHLHPQTPNSHTPRQSIHKSLDCTLLLLSPKSVCLWGVQRHRTGWCSIGVLLRSTLQTFLVVLFTCTFDVMFLT